MKKPLMIIGGVIIILLALFFALNSYIYQEKQGDGLPTDPYQATLSGKQVCLPHKDTSGPQTLECAIGMQTDSGEYYSLDFNMMSQPPLEISNGARFTATGTVTPIENLSSNHYQKYDIEGIFSVKELIPAPEETPKPIVKKCYIGGCSSQLCGDEPGMASTCEYKEEYSCYRTAQCEVQADGECGWTPTVELQACLGVN